MPLTPIGKFKVHSLMSNQEADRWVGRESGYITDGWCGLCVAHPGRKHIIANNMTMNAM
jgi:hypothetical protein